MKKAVNFGLACIAVLSLVLVAAPAMAGDISGHWELEVQTPSGGGTPIMELKQNGNKITGTYVGQLGETDVKGAVKGKKFTVEFNSAGVDIVYKGTFEGDSMKGSLDLGPYGMGTFTGVRK